jgi:GTP-dependent phosphoenolpyruvate carboxykinase
MMETKNKKQIKESIHSRLEYGDLRKIAKRIPHLCYQTVVNVLNPDMGTWREEIIEEAIKFIEEREISLKAISNKVNY